MFQESFKCVSGDNLMDVSRKIQRCFKSKVLYKVVLFMKVYRSMSLIAATRAEGGLVF